MPTVYVPRNASPDPAPGGPGQYHAPDGCLDPAQARLMSEQAAQDAGYAPCLCWNAITGNSP